MIIVRSLGALALISLVASLIILSIGGYMTRIAESDSSSPNITESNDTLSVHNVPSDSQNGQEIGGTLVSTGVGIFCLSVVCTGVAFVRYVRSQQSPSGDQSTDPQDPSSEPDRRPSPPGSQIGEDRRPSPPGSQIGEDRRPSPPGAQTNDEQEPPEVSPPFEPPQFYGQMFQPIDQQEDPGTSGSEALGFRLRDRQFSPSDLTEEDVSSSILDTPSLRSGSQKQHSVEEDDETIPEKLPSSNDQSSSKDHASLEEDSEANRCISSNVSVEEASTRV